MSNESSPDSPSEIEALRQLLIWCRDNPADPEALPRFNELRDYLSKPEVAADVLAAAEAVVKPVLEDPAPRPATHANMMVLMSALLDIESERTRVDAVFEAWLRHPASYGAERVTPPQFQKAAFVQRVADLLGWGSLEIGREAEPIGRFIAWVNTWSPKKKWAARRTIEALQRNFPAPEIWNRVRFSFR